MAHYLFRFTFTAETVKAMLANPKDRREPAGRIFAAHGGKMLHYFWMMGEYDGMAICDFADAKGAAAVSMTVASSGAFGRFETTPLLTMEEVLAAMELSRKSGGSYVPPGR
ncbi:MAG: GYD domain-containing protein [Alphaproteobacteria bacterium]|nr:GYD domain-containing protein [Alphaproteobacteria bacterium]